MAGGVVGVYVEEYLMAEGQPSAYLWSNVFTFLSVFVFYKIWFLSTYKHTFHYISSVSSLRTFLRNKSGIALLFNGKFGVSDFLYSFQAVCKK